MTARLYGWGSQGYRDRRAMRRRGWHVTSRCRVAARLAAITDLTIHEAARELGLAAGGVHNAWTRMYPTRPHPKRLGL